MSRYGVALLCAGCLVLGCLVVTPAEGQTSRASRLPHSHAPYYHGDDDGPVSMAQGPDGAMWAAWSYARGGQHVVAVSRSVGRTWTAPRLIGGLDGRDDLDPQIAFMSDGSPVVAWAEQPMGGRSRVLVAWRAGDRWVRPRIVSNPSLDARQPRLYSEGSSVAVGFITQNPDTGESGFTLLPVPEQRPHGGTNGPDPIPTITVDPGEHPSGGRHKKDGDSSSQGDS